MNRQHRWLHEEIAHWQDEGLIDATLGDRLRARYPAPPGRAWGRLVISGLGAVLVGLGVILLFAYNWAVIPAAAKLGLAFAALGAAHGAARWAAARGDPDGTLVESLHVFGTMLFGAGIWLVAQVYHIDGHYPDAFLVWSLGALALAWALPSVAQGMLALFLVAFWAGIELFQFHAPVHAAPVLVALGALPLAWWRRSPALLFVGLAVFLVVSGFALAWSSAKSLLPILLLLGSASVLAGAAAPTTPFAAARAPLVALGLLVACGCVYVLSFPGGPGLPGRAELARPAVAAYFAMAGGALAATLAMLVRAGVAGIDRIVRAQLVLLGVALAALAFAIAAGATRLGWPLALVFNVVALGLAVSMILDGSTRLRPAWVGAGCVLFALVAVSRYADLFASLLARAAVFVALGAGLFVVGNHYAGRKRRAQGGGA